MNGLAGACEGEAESIVNLEPVERCEASGAICVLSGDAVAGIRVGAALEVW